jgi:transposase
MYIVIMCPMKECDTAKKLRDLQEEHKKALDDVAHLKGRIAWFERQIFGQKTERFITNDTQEELDLGVGCNDKKVLKEQSFMVTRKSPQANKTPHGREELPPNLLRERVVIPPDFDTTGMEKIGEKITEELHYTAPVFKARQLVREVFATVIDGERTVVCAKLPPRCIDKGKAGPSVVAHVIVEKCVDHIPLYRTVGRIKRVCGMELAESTVNNWFERGAFWLEALANEIASRIHQNGYIQMDESTLKVMIQPTKGKSSTGHMWVTHAPETKMVHFHYDKARSAKVARQLIPPDYGGILQTDGYEAYGWIDKIEYVTHAGCNAHSRRKFEAALSNDKARASHALELYKQLFAVEALAREQNLCAEERLALRREKSAPVMTELNEWCMREIRNVNPGCLIGKAITYTMNQWKRLEQFLHDGRIEISNNLIENLIRPLALGRKNWMFAGSEDGARRLAIIYSILATCRLNDVNPFDYLCHVLEELPKRSANDIEDLLPMNWKPPVQ